MDWTPASATDVEAAAVLADRVHHDYPEDAAVFRNRFALYPAGFLVLRDTALVGYAILHPWTVGAPPRLNECLDALPDEAECLHLHDVAIDPARRGQGDLRRLMADLADAPCVTLVAVGDALALWEAYGFRAAGLASARDACRSYSETALYMIRGGFAFPSDELG